VVEGNAPEDGPPLTDDPDLVAEARRAVYALYDQGYIDDNSATATLLAIGIGIRRLRDAASE
jgi:hypothetical protein